MVSQGEYERALERAKKLGVEICARGWRRDDGSRVIGVTSASEDGRVHLVTVRDLSLECDCLGFQNDRFCMHRAVARQLLLSERYQRSNARIEAAERALHAAALDLVFGVEGRLPVRDTKPFSIFK